MNVDDTMQEKFEATLVGCAIGDSLGMPVEGWKREQIQKYVGGITEHIAPVVVRDEHGEEVRHDEFGRLKSYTRQLLKGEYTDDTILTLALAESIVEQGGIDLQHIADKQIEAFDATIQPNGRSRSGFGGTTQRAFRAMKRGATYDQAGSDNAPGNAPAMKMAPVALYMQSVGEYDQGLLMAEEVSRTTHLDQRSIAGGRLQAHAVYTALQGGARTEFVASLYDSIREWENQTSRDETTRNSRELGSSIDWVLRNKDATMDEAFSTLQTGAVIHESQPFALFAFQKYWDDPAQGLLETINYGGDCDTTAAMFGALSGARHGNYFPQKWRNDALGLDRLRTAAQGLYKLES